MSVQLRTPFQAPGVRARIFYTGQGSQFTGDTFTGILQEVGVAISMDGRGRVFDNIFVERLWRSVKYEEVYLRDYGVVDEARPDDWRRDCRAGIAFGSRLCGPGPGRNEERRIFPRQDRAGRNVVTWMPPLTIGEEELMEAAEAFEKVLHTIR